MCMVREALLAGNLHEQGKGKELHRLFLQGIEQIEEKIGSLVER